MGSPANAAVRERLIASLEELGLEVEVQRSIGCGFGRCARVANVLAAIPGEQPAALLLMAHYDSVPAAPGAGDDGAGVAALLETARILVREAPFRNSVLFAFTDAEEPGLLGAHAFFREHPWAKRAQAVINLEGSGSSGAVNVLRVGPGSGALVRAFAAESRHPAGNSMLQELFELLPNNTDFLHVMRAQLPGIDFAFAGTRLHYHTPLDTIDNLDLGTLQHHGDNVLPLARRLAQADLGERSANFSFVTVANRWWITWPLAATVPLALVALGLTGAAFVPAWRVLGWRQLAGGIGVAVIAVAAVVALEIGTWALADRAVPALVAWPAHLWPWRLLVFAPAAAATLAVGALVARRVSIAARQLGGWLLWTLLALGLAVLAPLAANVLLIPALIAAAISAAAAFAARGAAGAWLGAATVSVAVAGYWMLSMYLSGELVSGFAEPASVYGPLALLAPVALPLVGPARAAAWLAAGALLVTAAALFALPRVPHYSPEAPQHLNIQYVTDADRRSAEWQLWTPDAVPARLAALADVAPRLPRQVFAGEPLPAAPAPYREAPAPEVIVLSDDQAGGRRRLALRLRSLRDAPVLAVALPASAEVAAAAWAGQSLEPLREGGETFAFFDPPADGVRLDLELAGEHPDLTVKAYDVDHRLPDLADELRAARGALGVPAHSGDGWIVVRELELAAPSGSADPEAAVLPAVDVVDLDVAGEHGQ